MLTGGTEGSVDWWNRLVEQRVLLTGGTEGSVDWWNRGTVLTGGTE